MTPQTLQNFSMNLMNSLEPLQQQQQSLLQESDPFITFIKIKALHGKYYQ